MIGTQNTGVDPYTIPANTSSKDSQDSQSPSRGQNEGSSNLGKNGKDSTTKLNISVKHEDSLYYDSLIALFADNFCSCTGLNCKKELTIQFQNFMRSELSRKFVIDLINIIAGSSSKSDKIINILIYFLKYLSLN